MIENNGTNETICPSCQSHFFLQAAQPLKFCPFCKHDFHSKPELIEHPHSGHPVTLVQGHVPDDEHIQFSIGPYQIIRSIGKGGMGEVFLAYDTSCGRRIALKQIRTDLKSHTQLQNRFLKEARVTSQLTHPAIIPIYAIHSEQDLVYYTMPFVEGDTLKQVIRTAKLEYKKGLKASHSSGPIPALVRIFLSVCQAVAYAHSKGVLHRDLKPENIIVGRYGEVLILDWGLAKLMRHSGDSTDEDLDEDEELPKSSHPLHELTRIGKVVGTVTYMAPERAMGQPANPKTDIYSLGVILYQLLTLRPPFYRGTLKEFRENMFKEVLQDPMEIAPYRDVPKVLSRMACKCLSALPEERYNSVDELLADIENYIEGRSEWFQIAELDVKNKDDWEFQENVLIAEHMAITRGTEVSDWVSMMISKTSFPENTKIEAKVRIGDRGKGIGFLLSIPEAAERQQLNSGYCLWLASDVEKNTKLLRTSVEVMFAPEIFLQRNEWYHVRIEKIDNNIHFYLNDTLQFSYISHLPLTGTHIGLLARDDNFLLKDLTIFVGSQSIKVNCLAVPDAFLAHKDYATALSEYRRIGYSFPGTAEGREAMFRAGVTLLEEARSCNDPAEIENIYEQALEEFGKLQSTPGAPLGYLGKALGYQALSDYQEEIKCFELAYRRYPHHPLLPILQEQLVYRMHESSHAHRKATYHFVLLAIRHLSMDMASNHTKKLFSNLRTFWEPLYFIREDAATEDWSNPAEAINFSIQLAFWLAQPYTLIEIFDDIKKQPSQQLMGNALYALLELGAWELAQQQKEKIEHLQHDEYKNLLECVQLAIQSYTDFDSALSSVLTKLKVQKLDDELIRLVIFLCERAIGFNKPQAILSLAEQILSISDLPQSLSETMTTYKIWSLFMTNQWTEAGALLQEYSSEQLLEESSILYFLFGCWLSISETKAIADIHLNSVLDITYPRSWSLFNHFYENLPKQENWLPSAFLWEKRQLYRQCRLFHLCREEEGIAAAYSDLEQLEYVRSSI